MSTNFFEVDCGIGAISIFFRMAKLTSKIIQMLRLHMGWFLDLYGFQATCLASQQFYCSAKLAKYYVNQ